MYTDNDPILQAIKTERERLATMIEEARLRITALDACADALVGTEAIRSSDESPALIVISGEPVSNNSVNWTSEKIAFAAQMLSSGNTQRATAEAVGVSLGALQREIYRGSLKSATRRVNA